MLSERIAFYTPSGLQVYAGHQTGNAVLFEGGCLHVVLLGPHGKLTKKKTITLDNDKEEGMGVRASFAPGGDERFGAYHSLGTAK